MAEVGVGTLAGPAVRGVVRSCTSPPVRVVAASGVSRQIDALEDKRKAH